MTDNTQFSQEMVLSYEDLYSNPKYKKYLKHYLDFLQNRLTANQSVAYVSDGTLRLGTTILKDYFVYEDNQGTVTRITLKDIPFIVRMNGSLELNIGVNCISNR